MSRSLTLLHLLNFLDIVSIYSQLLLYILITAVTGRRFYVYFNGFTYLRLHDHHLNYFRSIDKYIPNKYQVRIMFYLLAKN